MIIFDLCCSADHRFEGWFRSVDEFSRQQSAHLVSCPHCGSAAVRRLPSAVHLASAALETAPAPARSAPQIDPRTLLKAVVDGLTRNSEDVGGDFAAEARRIHYREAPERTIRGEASEAERAALAEEGIAVLRLPRIKPEDLN